MKSFITLFLLLTAVNARQHSHDHQMHDIEANSKLGVQLLNAARRLDSSSTYADPWVAGYSLKFQGCHHISQWNNNVDGDNDVRIETKRLIRFRLCPSNKCSTNDYRGCTDGYGDYIIDMSTYLTNYFAAKETYQEFECDYLKNYVCACQDDEYCLYDCYTEHKMQDACADANPYTNGATKSFNLANYMSCSVSTATDSSGNSLYVGPYCSSQGGSIYLGAFTDDACTNFADTSGGAKAYSTSTGNVLPYAAVNVVDAKCMSCKEPSKNNYAGNDASDTDQVAQVCEAVYSYAGKCEANLPYGTVSSPNNNACNYMQGIKIVRKDGTVVTADAKACNKTAAVFIGVFVVSFMLLSAYVYYLKTKLDRVSINFG
jgi:hypothetical protein